MNGISVKMHTINSVKKENKKHFKNLVVIDGSLLYLF
jgi:hypothetical protein